MQEDIAATNPACSQQITVDTQEATELAETKKKHETLSSNSQDYTFSVHSNTPLSTSTAVFHSSPPVNRTRTITTSKVISQLFDILTPEAQSLCEQKFFYKLGGQEQHENAIRGNVEYHASDFQTTLSAQLFKTLKWKQGNRRGPTEPLNFGRIYDVVFALDIEGKQDILQKIIRLSNEKEGASIPPKLPLKP
ncbi:hypothetical protein [Parashewanella tropica]|uniref:hypothetical protein n=1 Tax=Parashewanella tropica TaxID=2547970 RepID=UPI00105952D4|nr:hypothetical protein [Parashewanella tropica]